jgi:hypoxanthine phosphoribosyltransferase
MSIENKVREVVVSKEEIATRVAELGKVISEDYKDKNLIAISLLKGSFIFAADLVREIKIPVRIEFMTTSSYGHGEETTGVLKVVQDIKDESLEGFDVLIVDDITDSAITMTGVIEHLKSKNPRSIKSCVLLDKPSRRKVAYEADYVGFEIPDKFIVGYGLNYGDYFRNEDHVFAFVDPK